MSELSIRHYLLRHSSGEGEVQRGKVSVRNSPTTLSVDQCTNIDEASGGVSRERDSQVTGFHSSHSPPLTCGLAGNGMSGTLFEVVRELAVD